MARVIVRAVGATVAGIAAGIAAVLAYAFGPTLFGAEALIVTSGSMGDAVPVGSVAITRLIDANAVAVGDVITFRAPGGHSSVTHRVIEARHEGAQRVFVTKGDANPAPDVEPVYVSDRVHRVQRVVPYAGRVVAAARTPAGGVALILLPIIGLIADRRRASAPPGPAGVVAEPVPIAAQPGPLRAEPVAAILGGLVGGAIAFRMAGRTARKRPGLMG